MSESPETDSPKDARIKGDAKAYMDIINGCSSSAFEVLGAHPLGNGLTRFAVWAPRADRVSVVGEFNQWDRNANRMGRDYDTGIWELDCPAPVGSLYKYGIDDIHELRADPYAFYTEPGPQIASIVTGIDGYSWGDREWLEKRNAIEDIHAEPISIYELHLGGWRRPDGTFPSFRMIVDKLIDYVHRVGYNCVELLPINEHRPYESWGYQTTGYFAPTSYYGTPTDEFPHGSPEDFMYFVDKLHQAGIGVVFDWTPSHFSRVPGGLEMFDGSHIYENPPFDEESQHETIWKCPAPGTLYFNYRYGAVRSFLNSVMPFWIEKYHVDGFRLDALFGSYLIYLGKDGNGNDIFKDNYAGINSIKQLNHTVRTHPRHKNIFTSTEGIDRAGLTGPLEKHGSGFDFKWNMGLHFDILHYLSQEDRITPENYGRLINIWEFSQQERHILELSHDKEPTPHMLKGTQEENRDSIKILFTYLFSFPGKKLVFMSRDFGQTSHWSIFHEIDWKESEELGHKVLLELVAELNRLYKTVPALHKNDLKEGFSWVENADPGFSVIAFARNHGDERVLVVFNFSREERILSFENLKPDDVCELIFNSDDKRFEGLGRGTIKFKGPEEKVTIPPQSGLFYRLGTSKPR